MQQGGVKINGERIQQLFFFPEDGAIIQVGKNFAFRLKSVDKQPQNTFGK